MGNRAVYYGDCKSPYSAPADCKSAGTGFMENTMNRLYIRTVGLMRATAVIGLINLTYNMSRYEQIVRLNLLKD